MSSALQPGQVVRVRSRQYLVEDVVPPPQPGDQTVVRLSCLDDDAQGQPLEALWEKEVDAEVLDEAAWAKVGQKGFDPPRHFSAYLNTLRWNCVTSTDPKLFQAPYRAGIQVMTYQLEPLRKALRLPRVNLFIADDVGLGKTIEAGLIVRELLMRQKVRRIVVACPPSVVLQWRDELEHRFGLTFVVFDRNYILTKRRERGYGVNPWMTHSRFILSHALLRDEAYAGPLRDWLGSFSAGSLLILDEAHNAGPASGAKYAIDSILTRVVRDIAPRFEHRLFLTATPHNGHSRLWEWRIGRVAAIDDPQARAEEARELQVFGDWFACGHFDDDWSFHYIERALQLAGKIEHDYAVARRLTETASKKPLESVRVLKALVDMDEEWGVLGWTEEARAVLKTANETGVPEVRREVGTVVNMLGERGFFEFRDLLPT